MSRYRSTQKYLITLVSIATLFFGAICVANYYLQVYNDSNSVQKVAENYGLTDQHLMSGVESLYVIPGGGSSNRGSYPEWTRRRVSAAFDYYVQSKDVEFNRSIFVALSAGSLNAPNAQLAPPNDSRVVFECQHTIEHLRSLGVRKELIFGDIFSWDTVTNAMTLRMMVESIIDIQLSASETVLYHGVRVPVKRADHFSRHPLQLHVFISDFQSERVRVTFNWVLGLSPSLLPSVTLVIHNVSSSDIPEFSPRDLALRFEHERNGVKRILQNMESIHTLTQFHAFLVFGGHNGIHSYLHADYLKSKGTGW
jgi:hypothetical protein